MASIRTSLTTPEPTLSSAQTISALSQTNSSAILDSKDEKRAEHVSSNIDDLMKLIERWANQRVPGVTSKWIAYFDEQLVEHVKDLAPMVQNYLAKQHEKDSLMSTRK